MYLLLSADAYHVLPALSTGSYAAIITDPPYGVGRESWDSSPPPQELLSQCLRVSAGPVVWFGSSAMRHLTACLSYDPAPDRMLVWAPAVSFSHLIKHGMFFQWHPIWVWRPPAKQDAIPRDVLRHNTPGKSWWDHPHTKPLPLMVDLVKAFTQPGDAVLDPFAGSGTTLVACQATGRHGIGLDITPAYLEIAERRLAEEPPLFRQGELFATA